MLGGLNGKLSSMDIIRNAQAPCPVAHYIAVTSQPAYPTIGSTGPNYLGMHSTRRIIPVQIGPSCPITALTLGVR